MESIMIMFVSLGCDKNLVDTEKMLGILGSSGYQFTDDETAADVIVVNTCCFIHDAKQESIDTLLEMARMKTQGKCRLLIAAGCLAQRYEKEIAQEIPEVDALIGTASYDLIAQVIDHNLHGERENEVLDPSRKTPQTGRRVVTTGGYYAHLKIAEGCDKCCTYCIIPRIRGHYRSVPMEQLVEEARQLASEGVKELILVAQETTLYGVDLYGEKSLHRLLEQLCEIDGLEWIRILYCYPEEIYPLLIETIKKQPKICHYLDMPIQHASDHVLRLMGRKTTQQELRERIGWIREQIPDMVLRTTLITGFPGETQEDHETMLDFVYDMEFDRLGVFPFSPEEGTPAYTMEPQVPEEISLEYRDEIMEMQQDISFDKAADLTGRQLQVLVEGRLPEEGVYVGRTYMDAPGIDGQVFVTSPEELVSGELIQVRITGATGYDLTGEQIFLSQ